MGKGAYMLIVNNDSSSHSINIHNRTDMYDNGSNGSNISLWDNQTLVPLQAMPASGMQYIEAEDNSAKFDVTFDDTTTVHITESSGKYDYSVDNSTISLTICVNNEGNEQGQAFITIVVNRTSGYSDWMHYFNSETGTFFQKTLSQVCLPGAHDAGMSLLTKNTSLSNECNTQTQEHSIGGQLSRGVRYFDLRPAIWSSSEQTIYMGHFSSHAGYEFGAIGQSLSSVLSDVASFIQNDPNNTEIVVLKFSHFVSQDESGFTNTLLTSFISQLKGALGNYMYTNTNNSVNLGSVTLQSIINSGKRVICLLTAADTPDDGNTFTTSQLNAQINPSQGLFSFGDNNSSANFRLYDQYAADHDYDDMVSDQVNKWKNFSRSSGAMFLFSYTLTSTTGGVIANAAKDANGNYIRDCVLDMADSANPVLTANLAYYKQKNNISQIPNILYIDKVSGQHPVKSALYINKLFL